MSTMIRHVFTAVLFSLFLALILVGLTLLIFPLDDWSLILKKEIGNVSFLLLVIGISITLGTILGLSIGRYWKQRLHQIEHRLDEMVKGQKFTTGDVTYKELGNIEMRMEQLQEKLRNQTEYSQRLATERANEREQSLQEIVVQERNRLARELHDSVSQQLFAASMMMSAINESNPPEHDSIKKQMQMVENMIHQSQLEMRALLLHLRPAALKGKSLQKGVEELLIEMTQKVPMEIDWKIEEFRADKGVEDQLFRILQESMSNTLRHAEAVTFHVMLIERDETVILRTVDNGKGFDMENSRTGSYGLQNMRERAYEVGGFFKVISVPNEGTQLEVKVPNLRKEVEPND
ncbi:sensor histidine kinase [Virgibacillus sp. NKC19-3]|uniref:sensor histidine kinase n=1 Tax=Virgibacillus saliphilus TaxID=2831674 RepID=UPI001C9BA791|nr:sensor histidine kinase [Virgibacillus sp. NKC19-3]MBY7144030.1 sensor histidine kinase [Virgibacillus sp. NKC19-3]